MSAAFHWAAPCICLRPTKWTFGSDFVLELGSTDAYGVVFDQRVDEGVQMIYAGSSAGDTDAVFSHEGTIAIWTLMNVNNPDFPLGTQRAVQHGRIRCPTQAKSWSMVTR